MSASPGTPRLGRATGTAIAALVLSAAIAACSGTSPSEPRGASSTPPSASIGSAAAATSPIPASPVVGVITHVDASGLSAVAGFTLRTADGRVLDLAIGTLENGAEFPPGHLAEHQATAEPVRVSFRVEGSRLVVYRIDDAGGSGPANVPASGSVATTPGPS